ncbi:uncharacterized protein LOC101057489 isoform X2 [Pan troglodytes]|uniref:uncharacterized protein LOC101057489 isoform X2 n=1 Tax=Pan troglodytes TaxID=9598 RepID=UPI003013DB9B
MNLAFSKTRTDDITHVRTPWLLGTLFSLPGPDARQPTRPRPGDLETGSLDEEPEGGRGTGRRKISRIDFITKFWVPASGVPDETKRLLVLHPRCYFQNSGLVVWSLHCSMSPLTNLEASVFLPSVRCAYFSLEKLEEAEMLEMSCSSLSLLGVLGSGVQCARRCTLSLGGSEQQRSDLWSDEERKCK